MKAKKFNNPFRQKISAVELFFGFIALVEFAYLCYINIFKSRYAIDHDLAKLFVHTREMVKNGSFIVPGWNYMTTGEFDCTSLIAIPIIALTGNLFSSFGIANVVNIVLWTTVLLRVSKNAGLNRSGRFLVLMLAYIPYEFAMVGYTNMMFFAGGQYVYKVLVPMLMVMLLTDKKKLSVAHILLTVVFAILLFTTSVSSGLYVLMCGILPIVACIIVYRVRFSREKGLIRDTIWCLMALLISMAGVMTCKRLGINPNSESIMIRGGAGIVDALKETFNNLILLLWPALKEATPALSIMGIFRVLILVPIVLIFFGFGGIKNCFASFAVAYKEDAGQSDKAVAVYRESELAESLLISIFVWNFMILFLTDPASRYHLMGVFPLTVVGAKKFEDFAWKREKRVRGFITCVVAFSIIACEMISVKYVAPEYFAQGDIKNRAYEVMIGAFDRYETDTVFFTDDSELPEILRVYDPGRMYETYVTGDATVSNFGFYTYGADRGAYSDRNMLVVRKGDLEKYPEYIAETYEYVESLGILDLYVSDYNSFDGISGPMEGRKAIDMASTPGYYANGSFGADGYFSSSETGVVISSPEFTTELMHKLSFSYVCSRDNSYLDIYENGSLYKSILLTSSENDITVDLPVGKPFYFCIRKEDGKNLTVGKFSFD